MSRHDRCPCGSGKPRKACCGRRRSSNLRLAIMALLIVIAGGGIAALGLSMSEGPRPSGASPTALGTTVTPKPYEYDPVNNRHWHPDHGHWHDGPPPGSDPLSTTSELPVSAATGSGGPAALPGVSTTPLPWQYDRENDRHWHPDHGHWHDGPPPPGVTTPSVPDQPGP